MNSTTKTARLPTADLEKIEKDFGSFHEFSKRAVRIYRKKPFITITLSVISASLLLLGMGIIIYSLSHGLNFLFILIGAGIIINGTIVTTSFLYFMREWYHAFAR